MTSLAAILDGFEAALQLERELGRRLVEMDRTLLRGTSGGARVAPAQSRASGSAEHVAPGAARNPKPETPEVARNIPQGRSNSHTEPAPLPKHGGRNPPPGNRYPFVFLHHRPLKGQAAEMIAKITAGLGYAPEAVPVVVDAPLPEANVYVVLGGGALKKFFPGTPASYGKWLRIGAQLALFTFSPEYILRFTPDSPEQMKVKRSMWTSLKNMKREIA